MSLNIKNIKYNDFKNICRTCLLNCDLKPIQHDNIIIEILHKLDVRFETNDELPQQICLKCFEKIYKIQEFVLQCNETYSSLIKCLPSNKNCELNEEQDKIEKPTKIKEEITIDEHKIEFVPVNNCTGELKSTNLQIKEEEEMIIETNEFYNDQNINDPESNISENNSGKMKEYMCDICNKRFTHLSSFKRHKTVHSGERPFVCDICYKTFPVADTLKLHKRLHSGERPYKCDQCLMTFTDPHYLKRHMLSHSGERPYKCDVCGNTYTYKQDLKIHQRKHSGELPYQCDVCDRAFNVLSVLRSHKATHSDERPFACDICAKTFKLASDVVRHKKLHSMEYSHGCDSCGKTFKFQKDLVRHQKIHGGERAYECDICNKSFTKLGAFNKHRTAHELKNSTSE